MYKSKCGKYSFIQNPNGKKVVVSRHLCKFEGSAQLVYLFTTLKLSESSCRGISHRSHIGKCSKKFPASWQKESNPINAVTLSRTLLYGLNS